MSVVNNKKTEVVYVFAPYGDDNVNIMRQCESSKFDSNSKSWKIDKARLGEANPAIKNFVMFDNYSDTMKYLHALLKKDEKRQEEIKKNSLQNTNEELVAQIGKVFDSVKAEELANNRKKGSEDYKKTQAYGVTVNFILPTIKELGDNESAKAKHDEYLKAFRSSDMTHYNSKGRNVYKCDSKLLPYIHPALKDLPMYDTSTILFGDTKKAEPLTKEKLKVEEIGSKYNVQAGEKRYEKKMKHIAKIEKDKQAFADKNHRVYVKYSDYTKQVISGLRSKFNDNLKEKINNSGIYYDKVSKLSVIPKRTLKDCPKEIREAFLHCTVYANKIDAVERKNPVNKLSKQWFTETSDLRASVIDEYKNKRENSNKDEKPTFTLLDVYADTIKVENTQTETVDNVKQMATLLDTDEIIEGNLEQEETQAMIDYYNSQAKLEEERGLSEDDLDFSEKEEQEQGMSR